MKLYILMLWSDGDTFNYNCNSCIITLKAGLPVETC
jgi:hypothetical protein